MDVRIQLKTAVNVTRPRQLGESVVASGALGPASVTFATTELLAITRRGTDSIGGPVWPGFRLSLQAH